MRWISPIEAISSASARARADGWADRAWLALLGGLFPTARPSRDRLIVTPATLLRRHRELLRHR